MSLVIHHPSELKFSGEPPTTYFNFKYPLDHFQLFGCTAIDKNENLLVTAHTGSGKTVLALYAIARCIAKNQRVIYISPIKTLSNQKYNEFGKHFQSIGILTGDIKINPDAQCLIMTAEILRNFLVSHDVPSYFTLDNVTCVVLDEVHFINNVDRGRVWEEILLYLNPSIQLVMLSATLHQPLTFVEWISKLKNIPCHLVGTVKRPIPLCHFIYWDNNLHCFLKEDTWKQGVWTQTVAQIERYYRNHRWSSALFQECLTYLEKRDLLPATVFLLNREMVEKQASVLYSFQKDYQKVAQIEAIWNKHMHKYCSYYETTEQWILVKSLVIKGIGIHHSGMIPLLKEIVEILYTEGLLPVLLATETFALGVNAPTKTTVFTNLQKFDGIQKRNLYSEEYNQMAGRAGRRGLDTSGTIVILPHNEMISETMMHKVALAPPQSIKSRLELDYSVVIHNNDNSKLCNTLFYQQQDVKSDSLVVQVPTLQLDLQHQQYFPMVQEVQDLEQRMKPDGYIRLDKKIEKKYKKRVSELMRNIPETIYLDIMQYNGQQKNIQRMETERIYNQERWGIQISMIHEFLLEQGFLCSKEPLTFSKKGIIMREIHDGNPLLMAELLFLGVLDDLPTNILIAMLSMLVVDKERDRILYSDLNLSQLEENCIRKMEDMAEAGQSRELVLLQKLPFPFRNDWVLSKTMYLAVRDWYDGHNWHTIKQHYGDFEGNFIKNILRLVNFLQCILNVVKLIQNVPLIQKLDNVQEKLVRDIVMNDSLYIQ